MYKCGIECTQSQDVKPYANDDNECFDSLLRWACCPQGRPSITTEYPSLIVLDERNKQSDALTTSDEHLTAT